MKRYRRCAQHCSQNSGCNQVYLSHDILLPKTQSAVASGPQTDLAPKLGGTLRRQTSLCIFFARGGTLASDSANPITQSVANLHLGLGPGFQQRIGTLRQAARQLDE